MFYILIALLAGAFIVFSRIVNSNLAIRVGTLQGTLVNYVGGLIFAALFLAVEILIYHPERGSLSELPWWAWLGGLTGVMVVVLSNYITPRISSFAQTLLVFIGQLFTGIVIDYFGSGSISVGKIVGGAFVLAGLVYNTNIDRKEKETEEISLFQIGNK